MLSQKELGFKFSTDTITHRPSKRLYHFPFPTTVCTFSEPHQRGCPLVQTNG